MLEEVFITVMYLNPFSAVQRASHSRSSPIRLSSQGPTESCSMPNINPRTDERSHAPFALRGATYFWAIRTICVHCYNNSEWPMPKPSCRRAIYCLPHIDTFQLTSIYHTSCIMCPCSEYYHLARDGPCRTCNVAT